MSALSMGRKGSGQLEVMQKAGWKIDGDEKGRPKTAMTSQWNNLNFPSKTNQPAT